MSEQNSYVRTDEHRVMRVADTRVMLDSVVAAFNQGHSELEQGTFAAKPAKFATAPISSV